jgi:hypothetical protein
VDLVVIIYNRGTSDRFSLTVSSSEGVRSYNGGKAGSAKLDNAGLRNRWERFTQVGSGLRPGGPLLLGIRLPRLSCSPNGLYDLVSRIPILDLRFQCPELETALLLNGLTAAKSPVLRHT